MRVVCDNCGATYKIPEHKLVKEVNKATCRKCGHRMLIRRPAAARSTAGAVTGGLEAGEPARAPRVPDPSSTGVRMAGPASQGPDSAAAWADEGPTRIARSGRPAEPPDERPTVALDSPPPPVPAPAAAPPAVASAPILPPVAAPAAVETPAPKPAPAAVTPAAVTPAAVAPAAVAPARKPAMEAAISPVTTPTARTTRPAPRAFDPSSDLTWAVAGSVVAAGGALGLAITGLAGSDALRFGALMAALGGTLTTLFVLATSARGRRKASVGLSLGLAVALALVGAGGVELLYRGLDRVQNLPELARTDPGIAPTPQREPVVDDGSAAAALAEEEEPPPAPEPEEEPEVAVAAVVSAPAPTRAPPPPTNQSAREAAVAAAATSRPAPPPPPEPEPVAEEPASPPPAQGLPTSVVETILRNNKAIKRCFMDYKQQTGSLPSRVDVRFTVENAGRVSAARVTTERYRGTDFDVCLGTAFRGIQFPPFEGEPVTMVYPFIL